MCFRYVHFICIRFARSFVFFKPKTAYEMRISDWSSDVCSSDLARGLGKQIGALLEDINSKAQGLDSGDATRVCDQLKSIYGKAYHAEIDAQSKLGRASCRERVCQYV